MDERVELGRITGLFGIKGWVKVFSYTEPRINIAAYPVWQLRSAEGERSVQVEVCKANGKAIVAKLAGIEDPDQAAALVGADIAVGRDELPAPEPGRYYWSDLEGLTVRTASGSALGQVHHLIETGAHDVLVVRGERERLIPFVPGETVTEVNLDQGLLMVDWDPDF
jgi:16S rRNA processing protein RimM